jgi:hypothetical protein
MFAVGMGTLSGAEGSGVGGPAAGPGVGPGTTPRNRLLDALSGHMDMNVVAKITSKEAWDLAITEGYVVNSTAIELSRNTDLDTVARFLQGLANSCKLQIMDPEPTSTNMAMNAAGILVRGPYMPRPGRGAGAGAGAGSGASKRARTDDGVSPGAGGPPGVRAAVQEALRQTQALQAHLSTLERIEDDLRPLRRSAAVLTKTATDITAAATGTAGSPSTSGGFDAPLDRIESQSQDISSRIDAVQDVLILTVSKMRSVLDGLLSGLTPHATGSDGGGGGGGGGGSSVRNLGSGEGLGAPLLEAPPVLTGVFRLNSVLKIEMANIRSSLAAGGGLYNLASKRKQTMNMRNFQRPFHELMANPEISKAVFNLVRRTLAIAMRETGKAMFALTQRLDDMKGVADEEEDLISKISSARFT